MLPLLTLIVTPIQKAVDESRNVLGTGAAAASGAPASAQSPPDSLKRPLPSSNGKHSPLIAPLLPVRGRDGCSDCGASGVSYPAAT